MGTFFRFRAVFATKTFLILARFLSNRVQNHCKFSAQLEYRVKIKKKIPKKSKVEAPLKGPGHPM